MPTRCKLLVMMILLCLTAACSRTESTTTTVPPTDTPNPNPTQQVVSSTATLTSDIEPPLDDMPRVIAFTSERDGNMEIYIMSADGNDPQRLTNHPAEDYWPTWSPDGAQIAFASERDGNFMVLHPEK